MITTMRDIKLIFPKEFCKNKESFNNWNVKNLIFFFSFFVFFLVLKYLCKKSFILRKENDSDKYRRWLVEVKNKDLQPTKENNNIAPRRNQHLLESRSFEKYIHRGSWF